MTALLTPPEATIQQIQSLLSEGYGSGFTIFKELVQNADDVGANRLLLAGHEGFPDADNVLLRAPGIFVANDGPVSADNWRGLQLAAGGSKGGDSQAVGRFGLGQKALYHLCDAYPVFARIHGGETPTTMVLNPYEEIPAARLAHGWKNLNAKDTAMLAAWADGREMGGGLVLYIPLRTEHLRPSDDRRISLTRTEWTPREALKDILDGEQLHAALSCLRHLKRIDIECPGEPVWQAVMQPGFTRLAGPGEDVQGKLKATFGGAFSVNGEVTQVHGAQRNSTNGQALALRKREDWPMAWALAGPEKAKATPHGAAIFSRRKVGRGEPGSLRVWQGVYLPLGDPARDSSALLHQATLECDEHIDLVVHGDFFVSSNRSSVLTDTANKGQDAVKILWNKALNKEASLPCVLDAVAQAVRAMSGNESRHAFIAALGNSEWWTKSSSDICGDRALARFLGAGADDWHIVAAAKLRPMPIADAVRPRHLAEAWPGFDGWCKSNGFILAQGTTLSAARPQWSDREMAEMITGFGPAALTTKNAAAALCSILEYASRSTGSIGTLAKGALGDVFRTVMREKTRLAPLVYLKRLSAYLPVDQIIALPSTVTEQALLAELAQLPNTLCLRPDWLEGEREIYQRPIGMDEAVALLSLLAPLTVRPSRILDQALPVIGLVFDHGPNFVELARHPQAQALAVIPVVRPGDRAELMLTPSKVLQLMGDGQLFHFGQAPPLQILAEGIVQPAIYQLRQAVSIVPPPSMKLASGNTPADRVAVVGKVLRFGTVSARAALLKNLREHLPPPLLRRLLTGEPGLRETVELARLARIDPALVPLVNRLVAVDTGIRVLDPAIGDQITGPEAQKAEVTDLDLNWLDGQLVRHAARAQPYSEAEAQALLASNLPGVTLRPLALHKARGEKGLFAAAHLLRGRPDAVPGKMKQLVLIVDPWPDPRAGARQRDLIEDWNYVRQVRLALDQAEPQQLCDEILDALDNIATLDEAAHADARVRAWLMVEGRNCAPSEVLSIMPEAAKAWGAIMHARVPVLRTEIAGRVDEILDKHHLVMDAAASYHRIFRDLAAAQPMGLIVDPLEHGADLAMLAKAKCDLVEEIWPIVASAVVAFPGDKLRPVMGGISFAAPDEASIIDQLNSLADIASKGGELGCAARRIWCAGFETWRDELRRQSRFYPADLLVETESGDFARADVLAHSAAGVEPTELLAHQWRFDLPKDYSAGALDKRFTSRPAAEIVAELFEPFRPFFELHTPVTMLLAMMGRGPAFVRCAGHFTANPGFADICAELEDTSRRHLGLYGPLAVHMQSLKLQAVPVGDGKALVLSAAGSTMMATADREGALVYECRKTGMGTSDWQLTYSNVVPRDLDHATRLLRDAAKKLVEPIGMRMNEQRGSVLAQFDSYLQSDQATLDELIVDIKDGLAERIKKLTRGEFLKSALTRYDEDIKRGRHGHDAEDARRTAKANLWKAVSGQDAARELLSAIREKMERRNYAPSRMLFELFQNAVDAAHQNGYKSDVRVEAERDDTGAIKHLRFVHWGRGLNVMGGPNTPVRYERDLDNMLDLDSSEKEEDHGKHGLGFKTTHMLSDDVRVVSGRLMFRIRGGLIPESWEDGRALQLRYNTRDAQATIIDIPIAAGQENDAQEAWTSFTAVAAFLPVTAPEIGKIVFVDGTEDDSRLVEVRDLTRNLALVTYGTDQRALRMNLGKGGNLYLKLLEGVPVPFASGWSRLWNLAPLDGELVNAAWLIDGRFEMDQGRRGLHGQGEDKCRALRSLGGPLSRCLIELFEGWNEIAAKAGLAVDGRADFFERIFDLFHKDVDDPLARELHMYTRQHAVAPTHGLSALAGACPVVPLAAGGHVRADDVTGVYRHSLDNHTVLQRVIAWLDEDGQHRQAIDTKWHQRLIALGFAERPTIDLGTLAESLFAEREVSAAEASAYASVYNSSDRDTWFPDEKARADDALKRVLLRCEAGHYVAANQLWFPQDRRETQEGATELLRAAFMPPQARLHQEYTGDAIEFAHLARARAGYLSYLERGHLESAGHDPERRYAALVFLAVNQSELARVKWLSTVEGLRNLPEYAELTRQQQLLLEARLLNEDDSAPTAPMIWDAEPTARDAAEILADIADWWVESHANLSHMHDQQVFGALCSPADLRDDDDVAWFTLLSLGSFQTIGRITAQQSRSFIERCVNEGWWADLARVEEGDRELRHYVDRLLAWTDIGAPDDYLMWRRCLGDMCMIARHLETYREIFMRLPRVIEQEGEALSLTDLLRPSSSHIVGRMGLDGGPLARSLGMGANWIVRELARRGVYGHDEARLVQPFAWSSRLRIRNFIAHIGLGDFESGVNQGRAIHDVVCETIGLEAGVEAPFGLVGDLPLEILNTRQPRGKGWLPVRTEILRGDWKPLDFDEVA